jgi:hypothetical protein
MARYLFTPILLALLLLVSVLPVSAAEVCFGASPVSITGTDSVNVTFRDTSTGSITSYKWNRTDVTGLNIPVQFSTSSAPTNIQIFPGNWSIQLITTNSYGTNVSPANRVFVNVTGTASVPVADFHVDNVTVDPGNSILFHDTSTGPITSRSQYWVYTDADGSERSSGAAMNLTVISIPTTGFKPDSWVTITLTVSNGAGSNALTRTNYVHIAASPPLQPPIANFAPRGESYSIIIGRDPDSGDWILGTAWRLFVSEGTTIQFNDTSTGGVATSWNWSFQKADGTWIYNSTQNASQYFDEATFGTEYRAMVFTASNAAGNSTIYTDTVVREPPVTPIGKYSISNTYGNITLTDGETKYLPAGAGTQVLITDMSYNSPSDVTWEIITPSETIIQRGSAGASFYYTLPNLTEGANISISFTAQNENGTAFFTTTDVIRIVDASPPPSISITNQTGINTIIWNWTQNTDISKVMVWKNGVAQTNVTGNGTTWTGLIKETPYEIATKTVDSAGNVNGSLPRQGMG